MAGEEDVMRLVAQVVDKYSGPLSDMRKQLRELSDYARGVHASGGKNTKEHEKAYVSMRETMHKVTGTVRSTFGPALATLGITAFGVGGAIAGVTASVKKLGDQYYALQDASKRAGTSVGWIRALSVAYESLGLSQQQAMDSAAGFGEFVDKTARGSAEALQKWSQLGGAYQLLWPKIKDLPRESQLREITSFILKMDISVDKKRKLFGDVLGMTPDIATRTIEQWDAALNQGIKSNKDHPYDPKLAAEINEAFDRLRRSTQGLQADLGNTFGGSTITLVNEFAKSIESIGMQMKKIGDLLDKWGFTGLGNNPKTGKRYTSKEEQDAVQKELRDVWDKRILDAQKRRQQSGNALIPHGVLQNSNPAFPMKPVSLSDFQRTYGFLQNEKQEKENIFQGTLRALRDWWNGEKVTTPGAGFTPGSSPGQGTGTGTGTGATATGPGGVGVPSMASTARAKEIQQQMARQFKAAGYPDAAIAGIMGNVGPESSWNPNMRHPDQPRFTGEAHYAHGLFQEGGTEWNNYSRWLSDKYPGRAWQDPKLQTEFLIERLNSPQYAATKRALMNARTASDAAVQFQGGRGWGYLRPSRPTTASRTRDAEHFHRTMPDMLKGATGEAPDIWGKGAKPLDLLKLGKQSGLVGQSQWKGDAALRIDVNAPPGSIKTQLAHNGFADVQFNRGLQMPNSSQVG